jgi:hypothetical protein
MIFFLFTYSIFVTTYLLTYEFINYLFFICLLCIYLLVCLLLFTVSFYVCLLCNYLFTAHFTRLPLALTTAPDVMSIS